MVVTFDTLSYAKRLREAGVPDEQANAHAEAALYLFRAVSCPAVISEAPATKPDLVATQVDLAGALDRMTKQITLRVSGMIVAAVLVYALLVFCVFAKSSFAI